MSPFIAAVPIAILETVAFYFLHWPHRYLLPDRFRTMLLAKGALKGFVFLGITLVLGYVSAAVAWVYIVFYVVLGICYHIIWCRKHNIKPLAIQPREAYILATTAWVEQLIELENKRNQKRL